MFDSSCADSVRLMAHYNSRLTNQLLFFLLNYSKMLCLRVFMACHNNNNNNNNDDDDDDDDDDNNNNNL